jgi:uncharacterized protein (DUF1697 family)
MPRYVAFLRGISPTNATMPDLKRCFEYAGFADVRTVLSSGNVVFGTRASSEPAIERRAEKAMQETLGRSFYTVVRSATRLHELLSSDPFAGHRVPSGAKRVVSFLREARTPLVEPPLSADGATVVCLLGREAFTYYVTSDAGPVFMKLIETAFGRDVTTRTWTTVARCAAAC